jgi:hypothetical protein
LGAQGAPQAPKRRRKVAPSSKMRSQSHPKQTNKTQSYIGTVQWYQASLPDVPAVHTTHGSTYQKSRKGHEANKRQQPTGRHSGIDATWGGAAGAATAEKGRGREPPERGRKRRPGPGRKKGPRPPPYLPHFGENVVGREGGVGRKRRAEAGPQEGPKTPTLPTTFWGKCGR